MPSTTFHSSRVLGDVTARFNRSKPPGADNNLQYYRSSQAFQSPYASELDRLAPIGKFDPPSEVKDNAECPLKGPVHQWKSLSKLRSPRTQTSKRMRSPQSETFRLRGARVQVWKKAKHGILLQTPSVAPLGTGSILDCRLLKLNQATFEVAVSSYACTGTVDTPPDVILRQSMPKDERFPPAPKIHPIDLPSASPPVPLPAREIGVSSVPVELTTTWEINATDEPIAAFDSDWLISHLVDSIFTRGNMSLGCAFTAQVKIFAKPLIDHVLKMFNFNNNHTCLALYYLHVNFPDAVIDIANYSGTGVDYARFLIRTYALFLMLASKWMDDASFRAKDWVQPLFCTVLSVQSLELAALAALDFNLSIFPATWRTWLDTLWTICAVNVANPTFPSEATRAAMCTFDNMAFQHMLEHDIAARTRSINVRREDANNLRRGLAIGLLNQVPRRVAEPAAWNPSEDPVYLPRISSKTSTVAWCTA